MKIKREGRQYKAGAIDEIDRVMEVPMIIRQVKYCNSIVVQNHRAVKRLTESVLGTKSLKTAKSILVGIELRRIIRNRPCTFLSEK